MSGEQTALSEKTPPNRPSVLLVDNRVIQCDVIAAQHNLRPGISLAAAHSIAPGLLHWQHDEQATAQHLAYLAQLLYRYSSLVSIDTQMNGYADNPGEQHHCILLEIHASLKLFDGLTKLIQQVADALFALGHAVRLQVAQTPLAAISGARWQERSALNKRTQPDPKQTSPNQTRKAALAKLELANLPLDCLPLTPRQGEKLHNMGLRNCGALLNLPRTELCQRFGRELGDHLARLTGELADPRIGIQPPRDFSSSLHLLDPCTSKQALSFPLKRLCGEFEHWLIAQQLGASVLCWRLANHSGKSTQLEVRISQPSQAAAKLLHLTLLHLERTELPRDVLDIQLTSTQLTSWNNHSETLFPLLFSDVASETPSANDHVTRPATDLIDQIRARLGYDSCSGVNSVNDHRPEFAWQRNDLSKPAKGLSPRTKHKTNNGFRPLFLLPTPQRIPASRLVLLQGPERIHGGWWHSTVKRDYYIAQTKNQAPGRYWVFVDKSQHWYVHGYFA